MAEVFHVFKLAQALQFDHFQKLLMTPLSYIFLNENIIVLRSRPEVEARNRSMKQIEYSKESGTCNSVWRIYKVCKRYIK